MKNKKLSPNQASGIAFVLMIATGVCAVAVVALFTPFVSEPGRLIGFISNATCPVAIGVGVLAYFWVKNRQVI